MHSYALPALYAIFVWWLSTGIVLYLDGLPSRTFRWSLLGASGLLIAALYGLQASAADASVTGAYMAFTCALAAWSWLELSFYLGLVTGPRTQVCQAGCAGWRHFGHAVQASLYHELASVALAAAVCAIAWNQPNQLGMWTFVALWGLHQSARLNVFLGVRNLNPEWLPEHLHFLRSFLTRRPMNWLFPFSITLSTAAATFLIAKAVATQTDAGQAVGLVLLATLMILGILEHCFLMLPLPIAALWNWWLRWRGPRRPFEIEDGCGLSRDG